MICCFRLCILLVFQAGGGGGGGGLAIQYFTGLTPGNTLTVTVGSGGAGNGGAAGLAGIVIVEW